MAFIWYLCIKYFILWISREVSRLSMSISSMAAGITISVVCLPSTVSSRVLTLALVRRVFVTVFLPTAIITSMMRLSSSGPGYCDSVLPGRVRRLLRAKKMSVCSWGRYMKRSLQPVGDTSFMYRESRTDCHRPYSWDCLFFLLCHRHCRQKNLSQGVYLFLAYPSVSCRMTDVSIAVAHCVVQVSGECLLTAKGFCAVGVACRRKGSVSPSARVWPDGDMTACCHVMDWSVWRSCAVILSRPSPATHGNSCWDESAVQRSGRLLVQEAAVGDPLPSWSIIKVWNRCGAPVELWNFRVFSIWKMLSWSRCMM